MRLIDYLMAKSLYVGFRVEVISRVITTKNLIKQYNSKHNQTQLFDLFNDGRITIEKFDGMLIARGTTSDKGPTGLVNFSVMTEIKNKNEIERVVQIVNVLGNNRLIRERINTFVHGHSTLNAIPEFQTIQNAFVELDSMMPGFIKSGWYYAPEAILK